MYDLYKPFRNYMRTVQTVPSLVAIYALHQHLVNDNPLPRGLQPRNKFGLPIRVADILFPWDLDVLVREVVLNGSPEGRTSFQNWNSIATAGNVIRRIDDGITGRRNENYDVFRVMHRIVHFQFPWQMPPSSGSMMRYLKIYEGTPLEDIVVARFGLPMRQLYYMGLAIAGHFLQSPGFKIDTDFSELGVDRELGLAFLRHITRSLPELRATTLEHQSYDEAWMYAWNPLYETPLIAIDPYHPERTVCPLPSLVLRRVSEGLFYDINGDDGFQNAYGNAFQAYVGYVLETLCPAPFAVAPEQSYRVGKNLKHGIDWILQDDQATVFIECKTKRLRHDAKFGAGDEQLRSDLDTMARAVTQLYKNILDAQAGYTAWKPTGQPIFPLIVTLEDWWLFTPSIHRRLSDLIDERFEDAGLEKTLLADMPFTIASINELEIALTVIAEDGILPFFEAKTNAENREWAVSPFTSHNYPQRPLDARRKLFDEEWHSLAIEPALQRGARPIRSPDTLGS